MDVVAKYNVTSIGPVGAQPVVFAHGFGCDQRMWRFVAPAFADRFRVVCFDHVGAGGSDLSAYDPDRHASLDGYAQDLLEILRALDLRDVVLVAHSVSASIGVLAEVAEPERFAKLVLVSPSPRFVDDEQEPYLGGFSAAEIFELLDGLDSDHLAWSASTAPTIMGNPDRPELGAELVDSFCRMDPDVARRWARATFLSDTRAELPRVSTPALVLQCRNDLIAPVSVGTYVRDAIPDCEMTLLQATGHCPQLSAPEETVAAIAAFV